MSVNNRNNANKPANNGSNNGPDAQEASKAIVLAMDNQKSEGFAIMRLTHFMHAQSETYSLSAMQKLIKLEGSDRVDAVNARISSLCEPFANRLATLKALTEKKSERTAVENDQLVSLKQELQAARLMFDRAFMACYGLRQDKDIKSFAIDKKGKAQVIKIMKDEDGKPVTIDGTVVSVPSKVLSARDLINAGTKAKQAIKPTAPRTVPKVDVATFRKETLENATKYINLMTPDEYNNRSEDFRKAEDALFLTIMRRRAIIDEKNTVNAGKLGEEIKTATKAA